MGTKNLNLRKQLAFVFSLHGIIKIRKTVRSVKKFIALLLKNFCIYSTYSNKVMR
jgi:hypothetical protein